MELAITETFDKSTGKYRRIYSLDSHSLCFLSVFLTEQRKLESISFDVESADDYHYQIKADQINKLCETLSCQNSESDIAKAFSSLIKNWKNPIEIASFLKKADIDYQCHYWY